MNHCNIYRALTATEMVLYIVHKMSAFTLPLLCHSPCLQKTDQIPVRLLALKQDLGGHELLLNQPKKQTGFFHPQTCVKTRPIQCKSPGISAPMPPFLGLINPKATPSLCNFFLSYPGKFIDSQFEDNDGKCKKSLSQEQGNKPGNNPTLKNRRPKQQQEKKTHSSTHSFKCTQHSSPHHIMQL